MSDSKVLLFGSFSEDETRSWMLSSPPGNSRKTIGRNDKQIGSLNFVSEKSSNGFSLVSRRHPDSSEGSINLQPSELAEKDVMVNGWGDHSSGASTPNEDKQLYSPDHSFSYSNGDAEVKIVSRELSLLSVSQNVNDSSRFKAEGREQIQSVDNSLVLITKENSKKASTAFASLIPRGLINSGNLCFLNSTLQALLSCSPFVQLLRDLKNRNIPKVGYPTLASFMDFMSEFDTSSGSSPMKKDLNVLEAGRPFSPAMFEGVLKNFTPDLPSGILSRPRQEDAQEFLSFIMDQMHDELLKLEGLSPGINGSNSSIVSSAEDDDWETVGRKNKSAVTRTQSFVPSELSDIFGGQLRSMVKAKGNKASATVQPYLLLHLDIYPEAVRTIEDALHLLSAPEALEGYRTSATGKAGVVTASRTVKIQKLSKIMILHLKRFGYGRQGSTKLHKPVQFPLELMLNREFLVSPSTESRRYELVATITHHGRESSKGHYTADVRYLNGEWLRFDDASVAAIGTNKVLHEQAYVLFYKQV